MDNIEIFAFATFIVQLFHSIEELSTGFHKRWYLFQMPFLIFLAFEILFTLFWATVLWVPSFPSRSLLLFVFIALMLANGIQHIVWWRFVKRYVPGLITAPLHVLVPSIFYFKILILH